MVLQNVMESLVMRCEEVTSVQHNDVSVSERSSASLHGHELLSEGGGDQASVIIQFLILNHLG